MINDDYIIHNLLTPDFLFTSYTCTSLKFELERSPDKDTEYPTRRYDLDNRLCIITYILGNKYSDLSKFTRSKEKFEDYNDDRVQNFKFLSNSYIPESISNLIYVTNDKYVKVNGVRYWFAPCMHFFTVWIFDGKRTEVPNQIFCSNHSLTIYLNSELISPWDINNWIEFVNKSNLIKCEVIDNTKYSMVSFRTLDLLKGPIDEIYTKSYDDSTQSIYIDSPAIVAGLIRYLRSIYPDFTICSKVYDLFNQKQKKKLLFYNAKLPEVGDTAGPPIYNPFYGMMRQINISISWEFLTDDFEEYMYFRECSILNTDFFRNNNFSIKDASGNSWSYGIDWTAEVGNEIDRSPSTYGTEETALFSVKFESIVNGWIIEKYDKTVKTILYPITRFYVDDWKFVGALFDHSDPNVYTGFSLKLNDQYYLVITGDRYYPEDYVNTKLFMVGPDRKALLYKDFKHKLHDWNAFDEGIVDLKLDIPINPLDLDHGYVYIYDNKAKQVYKDLVNIGEYVRTNQDNITVNVKDFLVFEQSRIKDLGFI